MGGAFQVSERLDLSMLPILLSHRRIHHKVNKIRDIYGPGFSL